MVKRIFGELELAILNIFQNNDSMRTVREVQQTLGREDKYTTVMTVMNRLVAKGELQREKVGHSYCYVLQKNKVRHSLFE
ncbi:MAG: BlaI/MecI/CopY family transcriptional regulator, partial [Chlamydiae bacterium]|nr:BlaI/MecI/CopY family transcriptional regulator [Chlamydiota bacterium]